MAQNDEKREKILEIKDLCMEFQDGKQTVKAVNHVSFDVYKGDNLGLNGYVQSGYRLISNNKGWFYYQRSGDSDTLSLTAGELVWITGAVLRKKSHFL